MTPIHANVVSRVLAKAGFTRDWNDFGSHGYSVSKLYGANEVAVRWAAPTSLRVNGRQLEMQQQLDRMADALKAAGYVVTYHRATKGQLFADSLRVTSGGDS